MNLVRGDEGPSNYYTNNAPAVLGIVDTFRKTTLATKSVWQRPAQTNGFGVLLGALKAHGRFDVPLPHGPDVFQFGDLKQMSEVLREGGFGNVDAKVVEQTLDLEASNDLVDAVLQGSVRMKSLLLAQDSAALTAIDAAVAKGVSDLFHDGLSLRVPMPAIVGSGTKP